MNYEQQKLAPYITMAYEDYFLTKVKISLVNGQREYQLPYHTLKVKRVDHVRPGNIEPTDLLPIDLTDEWSWRDSDSEGHPEAWAFRNYKIRLTPMPNYDDSYKLTIWFSGRPPDMSYGTALAGAARTITFASTPTLGTTSIYDNYYNGAHVHMTSGTGVGQINEVETYVGSTRIATMVDTWSTIPNNTSVYDIAPVIPKEYTELLVLGAVMRVYGKDHAIYPQWKREYDEQYARMIEGLADRQFQSPQYVRYELDPGYDY